MHRTVVSLVAVTSVVFSVAACNVAAGDSGHCTGTAAPCSGRGGGHGRPYCSAQLGCDYKNVGDRGDFVYECRGEPDACGTFDDADACGKQDGCRWEE